MSNYEVTLTLEEVLFAGLNRCRCILALIPICINGANQTLVIYTPDDPFGDDIVQAHIAIKQMKKRVFSQFRRKESIFDDPGLVHLLKSKTVNMDTLSLLLQQAKIQKANTKRTKITPYNCPSFLIPSPLSKVLKRMSQFRGSNLLSIRSTLSNSANYYTPLPLDMYHMMVPFRMHTRLTHHDYTLGFFNACYFEADLISSSTCKGKTTTYALQTYIVHHNEEYIKSHLNYARYLHKLYFVN